MKIELVRKIDFSNVQARKSRRTGAEVPCPQQLESGCVFWKVGRSERGEIYYTSNQSEGFANDSCIGVNQIKDQTGAILKISNISYVDIHDMYYWMMNKVEAIKDVVGYSTWMDISQTDMNVRQVELKVFLKSGALSLVNEVNKVFVALGKHINRQMESSKGSDSYRPKKIEMDKAVASDELKLKIGGGEENESRSKKNSGQKKMGTQCYSHRGLKEKNKHNGLRR